jgi:capsular polysaccharide biosynthesis protein
MEFRAYFKLLQARWPLILLLCLVGAAGSLVYSARAPRIYRAIAQISVTASVIEFWTGQAVERQLNNYAWRIRSHLFAEEVAARLPVGGDRGAQDLTGRIRAVAAPSEFRIAIEVDDMDAGRARDIANAAARFFVEKIQVETAGKERQDIAVEVGELAVAPAAPISPRPQLNATAGALLGALVGCLLAVLLEYLDDTVRSAREAEQLLALPILAAVPRPTSRGILDFGLSLFDVGSVPRAPTSAGGRPKAKIQNPKSKLT